MAETKTKPTGASVAAYLASRASPEQLADCKAIMAMCNRVTKQQPKMWGPSIVGYGSYTDRYASGHSGDACLTGFAVRGKELVVYLLADSPEQVELLARLGRHKMGKACLYLKRLADLDVKVLEALIAGSVGEVKRRYPSTGDANPTDPVQRQLDAYNAHDLERFVAEYTDDVQVFRPPAPEPVLSGKEAFAAHYAKNRFMLPNLHAEVINRMVAGNTVVDHERIIGLQEGVVEVIAVYQVTGERIQTVWFY